MKIYLTQPLFTKNFHSEIFLYGKLKWTSFLPFPLSILTLWEKSTRAQGHRYMNKPVGIRNSTSRLRAATSLRLLLGSLHLLFRTSWTKKHSPWGGWKRMSEKFLKLYQASISFCLCKHQKIQYWNLRLLSQYTLAFKTNLQKFFSWNRVNFCWGYQVQTYKVCRSAPLYADSILFLTWWRLSQNAVRYEESEESTVL